MRRAAKVDLESLLERTTPEPNTGCLLWLGNVTTCGYPRIGKAQAKVTRLVLSQSLGRDIDGLYACHRCDQPSCINPAHLYAGTALDNMRDKVLRGRMKGHFKEGHDPRRNPRPPKKVCTRGHTRSFDKNGKGYCAKCSWICTKQRRANA